MPWARSSEPGYLVCGNKFDLDRWDPEYFKRLKDFVARDVVTPGNYTEKLVLSLSTGTYKADWVDPALGSVIQTETFTHHGGTRTFDTPAHSVDIALRIKRS